MTTVTYLEAGSPSTSTDDVINPGIKPQQPNGEKGIEQSIPTRKIAGQPDQLAVTMTRPTQTAAQKSSKSQEHQNQLPQTNEKSTNWLALAGVGLMTLLSAVGIERKH
ncbi:LPXTG cell wall anchor domain-containing protein [Lactiplantibacillus daoliensis]|uniref:LPXTG cell wall anchor domain-containing protein n=1 Tax=Lactiplantibacillus daoliensis TaxID=2559916 RepID=A0ABW1UGD2_9LACO|nr:LPXTG cell wall anchor domain-containing protein [Lactiplantibacillus daoliensis]